MRKKVKERMKNEKKKMRQKGESMERNAEEGIRWRDDKKKEGDGER